MAAIINQGEESLLDLRDYHKQIITPTYRDYKNTIHSWMAFTSISNFTKPIYPKSTMCI